MINVSSSAGMEIKFIYLACRVYGSQDFSKTWRGDPEVWITADKSQKGDIRMGY